MDLTKDLEAPNGRKFSLNTGLFINNEYSSGSGQKIVSIDPANGSEIATVHGASAGDVDKAVAAARTAMKDPAWRNIAPTDRGTLLNKLADLVVREQETLATIESWDSGKPYNAMLEEEMPAVSQVLRYYAGWADKIHGETAPKSGFGQLTLGYTLREPIGVCAQIVPWNYPLCSS